MKRLATTLLALAIPAFATTAAHAAPMVRILEYGIFATDASEEAEAKSGPLARNQRVKRTRRIPVAVGVRFGFCAEITRLPEFEGKYTLTEIVRHPVMTLPNGTESAGWNVPRMVKVVDGRAVLCGGHFLRAEHELVPGKWRFTISDSDADLIDEKFEAVRATAR